MERRDGNWVEYFYDENGIPLYMIRYDVNVGFTQLNFFVTNLQGDVIAVCDNTNVPRFFYHYDAWGKLLSVTDINGNDVSNVNNAAAWNVLRYRGYVYDRETGLYYVASRYYDPEICRFINADCYIQTPNGDTTSTNMFAYCGNNPVNRYDPNGDSFFVVTIFGIEAWKIGVAFASVATAFVATDLITKNPPVLPPISLPKIRKKPKVKTDQKITDFTPTLPKPPARDPVHHIVAKADPRAAEARQILRDVGIEPLIDPRNLVVLPQSFHASLHTNAYYKYINERLRPVAGNKEGIEATLASLKAEILAHAAAGIRWD